jgi:transposase InsO family protein
MTDIDLSRLMGGKSFTIPCTLSCNGYRVTTSALTDTGANAFTLIDTQCAKKISEFTGASFETLKEPVGVKGFDGRAGPAITTILRCNLGVDQRKQYKVPFLVTNLGNYDVILGRKWLSYLDLWLDIRNRQLIWPATLPPVPSLIKQITKSMAELRRTTEPDPAHQADVGRRETAFQRDVLQDPRRIRILQRPNSDEPPAKSQEEGKPVPALLTAPEKRPPINPDWAKMLRTSWTPKDIERHTERLDRQDDLRKMQAELQGQVPGDSQRTVGRPPMRHRPELPAIDIACIGAVGFYRNLTLPNAVPFVTSLCEIDALIRDKEAAEETNDNDLTDEELVERRLPPQYHEFKDVFSKAASDVLPPHRRYDHKIELENGTESDLGYSPLHQQSLDELRATKQYIVDNLYKGFIESSQAPFAAPILFVKKPNGGLRFCIDYRKLNNLTRKDRYPLPLLDETLARLSKAKVFTKLDIRQAFHRIRMDPASEDLTTFRTRYGTYKCKVLPFGLTNGPATYQRYMNDTLMDYLDDFCTAYLDDIMIYSENELEHEEHVRKVLQRLRQAGLQADIRKSEFSVKRTKYLGFIVSTKGIEADQEKTLAIRQWDAPRTVRGVQSFLGFCNFYRRFIRNYGRIAKPLNQLTRKNYAFNFDHACQRAFQELKDRLANAPVLAHYSPELPSMLETDASDGVVAGVFSQRQPDGEWHPIAYFSKTMIDAELNYPIHDKEMLAIVLCLLHWQVQLKSSPEAIRVITDHKALEYFMTTKALTARQARWAEVLAQFNFRIKYKPGASNRADPLTRRERDTDEQMAAKIAFRTQTLLGPEQVDPKIYKELGISAGDVCPIDDATGLDFIDELLQSNRTAASLQEYRDKATQEDLPWTLENGLLKHQDRLVVTDEAQLRRRLIAEAHNQVSTAHPGKNKTRKIITDRYYWPRMAKDIDQFVRNCGACRRATIPRDKTPGLLKPLPIPGRPWQHISMDFHELPKDKKGYDMAMVVVDRFGKRPITIPCYKTVDAPAMAWLFICYIFRYFGPPDTIVSDRGPQFVSAFWKEFTRILGVKLKLSTAYHPQTDGQTEIVNQYLDQRLRPFVNYFQDNWSELLPLMDYAQATLPHDSTKFAPMELELGYQPRTSFDWQQPDDPPTIRERLSRDEAQRFARRLQDAWQKARENLGDAQRTMETQANKRRREPDFGPGDLVWVSTKNWKTERPSKKLDYQMDGPYEILDKIGNSYRLKLPETIKVHPVFSPDRLRKAAADPLPGQTEEPPLPIKVNGDNEWEVDEILASKLSRGTLKYRVKWKGCDPDPEWYPAWNFVGSPHKLQEFHAKYPNPPGPPKYLDEWMNCWHDADDTPPIEHRDKNAPRPKPGDRLSKRGG